MMGKREKQITTCTLGTSSPLSVCCNKLSRHAQSNPDLRGQGVKVITAAACQPAALCGRRLGRRGYDDMSATMQSDKAEFTLTPAGSTPTFSQSQSDVLSFTFSLCRNKLCFCFALLKTEQHPDCAESPLRYFLPCSLRFPAPMQKLHNSLCMHIYKQSNTRTCIFIQRDIVVMEIIVRHKQNSREVLLI